MARDFFDDDLLESDDREEPAVGGQETVPVSAISEAGLKRMAQQRSQLTTQAAGTAEEIERLRMRQEDLEREKEHIKKLAQKQEAYQEGKRDIITKLETSVIVAEKEQNRATRMAELLSETRANFTDLLAELKAIDESGWNDDEYEVQLDRANVLVENALKDYRKSIARIDAVGWTSDSEVVAHVSPEVGAGSNNTARIGFLRWIAIGFAVSLPVLLLIAGLFIAWLYFSGLLSL